MNKGLKIFTILVFLLSLGVFYLVSQVVVELGNRREEVKNLKAKIEELENVRKKLTQQVDSLTQTKENLEREVAGLKTVRARLERDLSEERRKVRELSGRVENLRREKVSLQDRLESFQQKLGEQGRKITLLEEERDKYRKMAEEEKRKRQRLEKELAFYRGEKTPGEREEKLVPQIEREIVGKVLEFQSPGVLALKFERGVNLRPGTVLYAFRKGKVVGKVTVKEIYSTLLVVRSEFESVGEVLKPEDVLRITRWVPEKK